MFYVGSDNRTHTDWGLDVGLSKHRELVLQVMATGVDNIGYIPDANNLSHTWNIGDK